MVITINSQSSQYGYPLSPPHSLESLDGNCCFEESNNRINCNDIFPIPNINNHIQYFCNVLPKFQLFIDNSNTLPDYVRLSNLCRRMTHLCQNFKNFHHSSSIKVFISYLGIKENISFYSYIEEQNPNGILLFSSFFKEFYYCIDDHFSLQSANINTNNLLQMKRISNFPASEDILSDHLDHLDLSSPYPMIFSNVVKNDIVKNDITSPCSPLQAKNDDHPIFDDDDNDDSFIIGRNSTPIRLINEAKGALKKMAPINKQKDPITFSPTKIIPFPPFSSPKIRMPTNNLHLHQHQHHQQQEQEQDLHHLRSKRIKRKKNVDKFIFDETFTLDLFDKNEDEFKDYKMVENSSSCNDEDEDEETTFLLREDEDLKDEQPFCADESKFNIVNMDNCIYYGTKENCYSSGREESKRGVVSMLTEMISSQGIGSSVIDIDGNSDGNGNGNGDVNANTQYSLFSNSYIDNLNIRDFNPSYGSPSMMSVSPPQRPHAPIAVFRPDAVRNSKIGASYSNIDSNGSLDERRRGYFASIASNNLSGTQSDTLSIW